MKENFLCPKCNAHLRVGDNVVFYVISKKSNNKGLIMLNPDLGDYTITSHPEVKFEKGEYVEFYCPVCHANLAASKINSNLVRVIMIDEVTGAKSDVYFSKVVGEKSTFRITDNRLIEKYGEDAHLYSNLFDLSE
jgi:rubredoxin